MSVCHYSSSVTKTRLRFWADNGGVSAQESALLCIDLLIDPRSQSLLIALI